MSAFDDAIDAIFDDPNVAADAIWRTSGAGDGLPIRIVRKTPQEDVGVQDSRYRLPAILIDVRLSEIAAPAPGDTVEIVEDGSVFAITRLATLDSSRLVQTCEAVPASP